MPPVSGRQLWKCDLCLQRCGLEGHLILPQGEPNYQQAQIECDKTGEAPIRHELDEPENLAGPLNPVVEPLQAALKAVSHQKVFNYADFTGNGLGKE